MSSDKRIRLTPLRRRILESASKRSLRELPANEEKAAFALSQIGLLHFHGLGPADYTITKEGREYLETQRGRMDE